MAWRTLLWLLLALMAPAQAQTAAGLPDKPLRILLPFAPGGSTDIVARLLQEQLQREVGQPVVVENRPGANGQIAMEATLRSRPDGSTAMLGNITTNGTAPLHAAGSLSFNYERDMLLVTRVADVPSVLVSTAIAAFPPRSMPELVAYARAHPGKLNYLSTGPGSIGHIDMVMLKREARIDVVHVPVSGGAGPSLQALIAGDVHFGLLNIATGAPLLESGQLRPLAVTGDRRLAAFPNLPTMAELGFHNRGTSAWHVLMVPSTTPPAIVAALHGAVVAAIASAPVQAGFRRQNIIPTPSASPAEAQAWFRDELALLRRLLRETAEERVE